MLKCNPPMLDLSISNLNRILNTGFSYDVAGNLLSDGSYSYSHDAENRMKTPDAFSGAVYRYTQWEPIKSLFDTRTFGTKIGNIPPD
jgi:hypothetical protein